jgi:Tfp pilus assembly PilM family ATPase
MSVAVNISNTNIKILAMEQTRITRWETVELEPGMVKDGRLLQPEAIARILDDLFENGKLPRNKVIASVTGMSFIYRILELPKLKNADLPEAIARATQKEINVPLGELYIDWQVVAEKASSLEIFVLGAPRSMVDAIAETCQMANLKLTAVGVNSLALARLVNQEKALIADFGRDWFDIVIVADGLPVTLHSVAPKGNFRELEDTLSQLSDEIRRTVDFFNMTHKENSIKPEETIYLSGISKSSLDNGTLIERYLPAAVGSANGHLNYPEGFAAADYAVLLGLAAKNPDVKISAKFGQTVFRNVDLNLLTGRSRVTKTPLSLKKLWAPGGVLLAVALIVFLMLARNNLQTANRGLQARLDEANHALNLKRMSISQTEATETQITQYLNYVKELHSERDAISGPGNLADSLSSITGGFSDRLIYHGMVSTTAQIIVEGTAASRTDVLDFTNYLETQNRFAEVRIGVIEDVDSGSANGGSQNDSVTFTVILERQ